MIDKPVYDYPNWPINRSNGYTGINGKYRTCSLFDETYPDANDSGYPPLYTLREEAIWSEQWQRWLPSARQIYLNSKNEYDFFMKLLGSYRHWGVLKKLNWFKKGGLGFGGYEEWQEEVALREAQKAEETLKTQSANGNVNAARILLDRYTKKPDKGSKKVIQADDNSTEDLARMKSSNVIQLKGQ